MDAPEWFRAALAAPREEDEVDVDGCPVHYLCWGVRDQPGLVLVHGGAAHAHWWDHVAPRGTRPRRGRRRSSPLPSTRGSRVRPSWLAPVVEVPLAHHHVMLDQPIPLVTGLRALPADWEHSVPQRRT